MEGEERKEEREMKEGGDKEAGVDKLLCGRIPSTLCRYPVSQEGGAGTPSSLEYGLH